MINPLAFHGAAISAVFIFGFIGGYACSHSQFQKEQQEIQYQQMETEQLLLDDKYRIESKLHEDFQNEQSQYYFDSQNVTSNYDSLVFNPLFDDIDWLSESNSTQSDERLSDNSPGAEGTPEKAECRCPKDYSGELQRIRTLYEKELKKAKECDLNAVQLNSLIEIVESIQSQ